MKILIAPDKFKGSLTALEVCNAVEKGIRNVLPTPEVVKLPLADGGEGSLEALETTLKFERKFLIINNPLFLPIKTWYGIKDDIAYIEMAKASGLQLLTEEERNPNLTTSFGTGELIFDAINNGAKKIFLFIGGSATNDAGIGIATALGYKFFDGKKNELKPIGENLSEIKNLKYIPTVPMEDVQITVLSDVQNPFFGENGAAHVYAEQKGASRNSILELDKGLRNISEVFDNKLSKNIADIPGSGAAGGIGGGMIAFFDAEIKSGIDAVFEMLNFDEVINECDFVITGEGKFDTQTLEGKVVKGVIDKCEKLNKPLGVVCGDIKLTQEELDRMPTKLIKAIKSSGMTLDDAMNNAYFHLVKRTEEFINEL